jgi:MFS family permease
MFYAYQELGWTSTFLGLVMSVYGIAMMLGEFGLSRLSDRFGRKPVILLGIGLFAAQFIGLAFFRNGAWIAASFILAGLGNALFDPALSATLMDMTAAQHQARVQGVKSMASSLGAILGPGLAVALTPYLDAQAVFLVAVGIVALVLLTTAITPAVQPAGRYNHRSEN